MEYRNTTHERITVIRPKEEKESLFKKLDRKFFEFKLGTRYWINDHRDEIKEVISYTPAVLACIPLAAKAVKSIAPTEAQKERNRIDHTYYDPSTGIHWELKRKKTNQDRKAIMERKAKGEDVYDILKSRHLI